MYAGSSWLGGNEKYYLYNGSSYWTMSPVSMIGCAGVFMLGSNGVFGIYMDDWVGLRPVLNIKADTLKFGDGSASNPFRTVN